MASQSDPSTSSNHFTTRNSEAQFERIEEVPSQKVRVAFFRMGDVRLELLEPTDPCSSVQKFLDKRGEGLHHLAFTVDDIHDTHRRT